MLIWYWADASNKFVGWAILNNDDEESDDEEEENVEVDELEYNGKTYNVDISTWEIYSDEGDIIGTWDDVEGIPTLKQGYE